MPGDNFQLNVSDSFDWKQPATVSMFVSKNKTGGSPYYASQLRIFPDERNFRITEPHLQEPPQSQYSLKHYLEALKYLPQEHIRSLIHDNPDMYIIRIIEGGIPDDGQPCVFYNINGLTGSNGWHIRLDVQPLHQDDDGSGYHGLGSDVIHVFYGDGSLPIPTQTYYLENMTEKQKFERLASITLYENGTANLATPLISSYLLPACTYSFAENELLIYANIETREAESAYGVKNGDVIAKFTVAADGALVFESAAVPLFADVGARYALTQTSPIPTSDFGLREWVNIDNDEQGF
ncbi:MAG TPA: hypothetical protein DC001_01865 [Clostridiales bacterium]|nr:hypothetical protein [Clostridiales bacterium]HBR09060.1 hypothetical protein [Clostridiales bacterium]